MVLWMQQARPGELYDMQRKRPVEQCAGGAAYLQCLCRHRSCVPPLRPLAVDQVRVTRHGLGRPSSTGSQADRSVTPSTEPTQTH